MRQGNYHTFLLIIALAVWGSFLSFIHAKERIVDYDVTIKIDKEAKLDITENIAVQVEGVDIRLGIFRDIPKSYELYGKKINTPITVHSVIRNGKEENFWVENHGNRQRIQIGAVDNLRENYLPHGEHRYTIHWSTSNHLRGFDGYDELYFNVTGNDWNFPIDKASATVILPDNVTFKQAAGYIGRAGSTNKAVVEKIDPYTTRFTSPRILNKNEGLTVSVGFTGGIMPVSSKVSFYYQITNKIIEFTYPFLDFKSVTLLFIFLITMGYYLICWGKYGKDESLGVITPLFEPPENVSPAVAAAIWHGKKNIPQNTLLATLVNLAAQGFISIGKKQLIKTKSKNISSYDEEQRLLTDLFKNKTLELDQYNEHAASAVSNYTQFLRKVRKKYIKQNGMIILGAVLLQCIVFAILPGTWRFMEQMIVVIFFSPFILIFGGVFIGMFFATRTRFIVFVLILGVLGWRFSIFISPLMDSLWINFPLFIFVFLVVILIGIHIIFYFLMDKPTPEAMVILRQLAGLKMFLKAVDTERYKLITPSVFEKNLPYAMIFGVEKKWIDEFKKLFPKYDPNWSSSPQMLYNYTLFSTLSSGMTYAVRDPSSSSNSGGGGFSSSGSSGGGSSGGGSGGGGGGGR